MTANVITTGDRSVLDAFWDPDRRLAVGVCAGGVRHAFTGGAFTNWFRRRLRDVPVGYAGVSAGIGTIINFVGGGKPPSIRIFSDYLSDTRMFDIRRRFLGGYPFDVDYVDRVFSDGVTPWPLNFKAAVTHHAPIYAVLGCPETGAPLVYEARTPEDARYLAAYGGAVTGFARPVEFQGRAVTDGFFTEHSLPVRLLCERVAPTDVLIFAGSHLIDDPRRMTFRERLAYHRFGLARGLNTRVRELIRTRGVRFMEAVEEAVAMRRPRVLVVWMPDEYDQIKISRETSRELIRTGYRTMEALFRERGC